MSTETYLATAAPFIPLKIGYEYDRNLSFQPYLFPTKDGYRFIIEDLFKNTIDLALSRESLLVLTSTQNLNNFVKDKSLSDLTNLGLYETLLYVHSNHYINIINNVLYATASNRTNATLFKIVVNSDNTLSFLYNNKYMTVNRYQPHGITFEEELPFNDIYQQQKFRINFVTDEYLTITTLFKNAYPTINGDAIIERHFTKGADSKVYALGVLNDDDYTINNPFLFKFENLVKAYFSSTGFTNNITWVNYHNNSLDTENNKNVQLNNKYDNIKINFLVDTPLKTKITLETDYTDLPNKNVVNYFQNLAIGKTDINIADLKNVLHPKYESIELDKSELYALSSENNRLTHRTYNKIFTGQREEDGYETPFLSYLTHLKEFTFVPDMDTYFHYPEFSPFDLPLSAANLIECGAIAGSIPFLSDRVYIKNADYKKYNHWGDSKKLYENGVWLCSWLSGCPNSSIKPVWKDRWYNPGFIDPVSATFTFSNSAITDIDSEMRFYPGVWYKYYHIGDNQNSTFINLISNDLIVHYENTINLTGLTDLSNNNNNGFVSQNNIITNYKVNDKNNQKCLIFNNNTDESCQIFNNETVNSSGEFTINIWAKTDDWLNLPDCSFLSTDFRGGYGLRINNGVDTPYFCICNNIGVFTSTNNENKKFSYFITDLYNSYNIQDLVVDSYQYVWCLDTENKVILRLDFDGTINRKVELTDYPGDFSQLCLSGDNIHTLYDSVTSKEIMRYNPDYGFLSSVAILTSDTTFDIDISGNIIATSGVQVLVDNDNIQWGILNDKTITYNLSTTSLTGNWLACSKDNYIYIAQNDSIIKVDNTFTILNQTDYEFNNTLNKLFLCNRYVNDSNKDFIYTLDGNNIIVLDNTLTYYNKLNYSETIDTLILGSDPSNYQYQRKYEYNFKLKKQPSMEFVRYSKVLIPEGYYIDKTAVLYPLSNLQTHEFYLITAMYDITGKQSLYIKSNLVNSTTKTYNDTYYKYRTPLLIGTQVGKNEQLNLLLKIKNGRSYKGLVHGLRFYNYALNIEQLYNIYRTKYDFKDLKWEALSNSVEYLEEIERFFKNKLPGQKSHYFNIRLIGLNITDLDVRDIIENIIKNTLKKIVPAYCELLNIVWE